MTAAEGIRKLGFRRWYERKLIESHLYLVTCFLCMVLVAVCLEALSLKEDTLQTVTMLVLVTGGVGLGYTSWQRFKSMFTKVMHLGEGSTCSACGVYARFEVTASGVTRGEAETEWLGVKCRKCGHEWRLGKP